MPRFVDIWPVALRVSLALLLATGLSWHGKRKKSLDDSGSAAAFFVGFISFAASYRFGAILIIFYLSSSRLTKLKSEMKQVISCLQHSYFVTFCLQYSSSHPPQTHQPPYIIHRSVWRRITRRLVRGTIYRFLPIVYWAQQSLPPFVT